MAYLVRTSSPKDLDEISYLVEHNYMLEEPIASSWLANRGTGFTQTELQGMKNSHRSVIESNKSLVAVDDKGHIVGVLVLIDEVNCTTRNQPQKNPTPGSDSLSDLELAVRSILQNLDFYKRFPEAKRIVKLRMLTVHRDHRGRGVSSLLLKKATEWAKDNGVDLLWSLFNAPASKRAADKVGFEVIDKYDLLEYEQGGRSVFGFIPEHVSYAMAYLC